VTAATVLALATVGLSACTSKVGQAAVVGGHHISDGTVGKYVQSNGPAPSGATAVIPKVQVLSTLIQGRIFAGVLANSKGGVPTDAELAKLEPEAAANVVQVSAADLTKQIVPLGYKASFTGQVFRTAELEYVLVQRLKPKSEADLDKEIAAAKQSVQVSQRYGSWDKSTLSVTSTGNAGVPSFLKLGSDVQAVATTVPSN
jgi:hypothetical protein